MTKQLQFCLVNIMDNTPVRVLQIVTTMNRGGLETMLMNYYRAIDRSRIQFDFLVHTQNHSDYEEEIRSLGGKIYHIQRMNPFSARYKQDLDHFFRIHPEYSIVHVHQDCMSAVALKAAQKNRIPCRIAHCHNASQDKNIKYIIKSLYRHSIKKYSTDLFSCSQAAGNWMFQTSNFQILKNGINASEYMYSDAARSLIRNELGIGDQAVVIGHVGRFNAVKNHTFLIKLFHEYHRENKNSILLLVGTGDLENKIKKEVTELGLNNSVIFTGVRSDVNRLLCAMDIFVFPSLYEGTPMVLIEAQASGLPCVISEGIPSDCRITDLITRNPLNNSTQDWIQTIQMMLIQNKKTDRNKYPSLICRAGYDINKNAESLSSFYLERAAQNWG